MEFAIQAPSAQEVDQTNQQVSASDSTAAISAFGSFPATATPWSVAPMPTQAPAGTVASILMYHYVRINPDPLDKLGAGLSVSPVEFERQMRYLVDNGYRVIGLDELVAILRSGYAVPPRTVVLTFDDGYMDFYQDAFPVLKRFGLKATSFVVTDFVGRKGYLTWDSIKEMSASGLITFGGHTVNHPDLTVLASSAAEKQIRESKRALEERLGTKVTLFAYPSGQYNATVARLVEEAGYLAAVTTRYGNTHERGDVFRLKRVRIDGRDTMNGFVNGLRYVEPRMSPTFSPPPTPVAVVTPTSVITPTPRVVPVASPSSTAPPPRPSAQSTATPALSPTVIVPNVVGLSEAEARSRLNAVGLEAGYTNYQQLSEIQPENRAFFLSIREGHVLSQQPLPSTVLKRGEKVNLAVRK